MHKTGKGCSRDLASGQAVPGRQWLGAAVLFFVILPESSAQESAPIPTRIVVAAREVPPFAMKDEDGEWTGISIDLLREVMAELQNEAEHDVALEFRELELDEMLDAVEQGQVDLAAAAVTVNYEREKRLDFTHPFHNSGLGITVTGRQVRGWGGVMSALLSRTFLKIVAGLFAVLLASGVAVYLFERKRNPHFGGGATKGIASGIWWAAVTMTTVGYGDKVPKSAGGRIIASIWMFSGLFIVASFTAAVTAALTVTRLESRIVGPADLSRVRVATVEASTSATYLRSRHIAFTGYPNVGTALIALKEGEADAVVYDAPILRHEVYRHYAGELFVLPITFERQDYAFALPSESPLRERINQVLLREIGSPEWKDLLADYLGEELGP